MTNDMKALLCDKMDFSIISDEILEFWYEAMI